MARLNRRIKPLGDGTFSLRLTDDERGLLGTLLPQLSELLTEGNDDSLRRLFPTAYPDDAEKDREYRELVGDDLLRRRLEAIEIAEQTIELETLTEDELLTWMGAVNDLRLVIGTQLDVSEETDLDTLDPEDPGAPLLGIYFFLGFIQEEIVAALTTTL